MEEYNIQEESTQKVLSECLRLGKMHYDEIYAHKKDKIPRNYNWRFLQLCMENGLMHIITCRQSDGTLIGYFVNLVSPDMFSSTFVAKDLAIFVHPDHRGNKLFRRMLHSMEEIVKENGVASQTLGFQVGFNDELPKKEGYRATEVVYEKLLQE